MSIAIKAARVWQKNRKWLENATVLVEGGKITEIGENLTADEILDGSNLTLLPGLVDVHTHGCAGYDFNTATKEQMLKMKKEYLRCGVTSLFPTLASATLESWNESAEAIQACEFDGIHLEGRYLNPQKRGAHAPELLTSPNAEELESVLQKIRIPVHITAALELDFDGSFAACARRWGATLGLGHTMATAAQASIAMENGATSFTHLYNCMPPLHHRDGGAVCTALLSDAWVELIADGMHVSPEMICLVHRCKEKDKIVLITDSMEATGCPDGDYAIAGQKVVVKNGRALTADGALAGSTLRLWDGVKNVMKFTGIPLEEAIAFATLNPSCMVGIERKVGSIEVGKRANLILVDDALQIRKVICDGKILEE